MKCRVVSTERMRKSGYDYPSDKRKRRRMHRRAAKELLTNGGFFNGFSAPGSTSWTVAQWHKYQARFL